MTANLSQRELESYLWGAATLLRGLVDASDYKQYIFPLLFFKRLSDVWDGAYQEALDDTGDEGYATATANDRFDATVKIPRITPYFGLGWGHQAREPGLGFVADVGVSIGRAKLSVHQNLLENYPGILTQNDIDVKTGELRDNVAKVRVLPQASIGISYRY